MSESRKNLHKFQRNNHLFNQGCFPFLIGNLTSQLFANVYMNPFDHYVKDVLKVSYYLRYTDDFIMVGQDPDALMALLPKIKMFLKEELKLDLHPNKNEL